MDYRYINAQRRSIKEVDCRGEWDRRHSISVVKHRSEETWRAANLCFAIDEVTEMKIKKGDLLPDIGTAGTH